MGSTLVTLDTSAVYSLLDRREVDHGRVLDAFRADGGPYLVPAATLAEIAWLVEQRLGARTMSLFLLDLEQGGFALDCGEGDLGRIRALTERYADLPLGTVDAAVIATAERNGGRVLTLDVRDFGVVASEGIISILPDPEADP